MKRKVFSTALLLGCFIVCLAAVLDLGGKWKCIIKAPDGNDYPVTYIFNIKGDSLMGTVQAVGDPKTITEGKITGNEFKFNVADDNGSAIPHHGKYYPGGDSISITIIYEGNELHSTLTRADK